MLCGSNHMQEKGTSVRMDRKEWVENRHVPPTEKSQVCLLSLSEGTGMAWLDWGKDEIAGLTPNIPITQLMGSRKSSLEVKLCCPHSSLGCRAQGLVSCWESFFGLGSKALPPLCLPRPPDRLVLSEALWSCSG